MRPYSFIILKCTNCSSVLNRYLPFWPHLSSTVSLEQSQQRATASPHTGNPSELWSAAAPADGRDASLTRNLLSLEPGFDVQCLLPTAYKHFLVSRWNYAFVKIIPRQKDLKFSCLDSLNVWKGHNYGHSCACLGLFSCKFDLHWFDFIILAFNRVGFHYPLPPNSQVNDRVTRIFPPSTQRTFGFDNNDEEVNILVPFTPIYTI